MARLQIPDPGIFPATDQRLRLWGGMHAMIVIPAQRPGGTAYPADETRWPVARRPIDAWVRSELSKRYDPVLSEELPEDLLSILKMAH